MDKSIVIVLKELARLFPQEERARMIVDFAEISKNNIDFSGSSNSIWYSIISEAQKHKNTLSSLLKCALEEYPTNDILLAALPSAQNKKTNKPFADFLKNLNHEKLGEISRVNCNRNNALKEYYKYSFSKCNITYVVGTSMDNPNNFVERIILEHLGPTSDQTGKQSTIWSYRNRRGDNRIDEIPFSLSANIDISLNNFKREIENSFSGINVDHIDQYFQMHQFRDVFISINYNYDLGNEILMEFTKEVYAIFNKKTETNFHVFFIMTNVTESKKLIEQHALIKKTLSVEQLFVIEAVSPAEEKDILSWKSLIGLNSYTVNNFIEDLELLKIPIEEISNYKGSKKLRMKYMEIFQNQLYDSFHKQK